MMAASTASVEGESPFQEQSRLLTEDAGKKYVIVVSKYTGDAGPPPPPRPPPLNIPGDDEDGDGEDHTSAWSSVFTLCNSAIGAGVLSLPFAFRLAGAVTSLLLCLVVGALEAFTLYVLSKFAERYDAPSYSALVRRALGRKLSGVLSWGLLLYLFGSCVAYMIIIEDMYVSVATPLGWAVAADEGTTRAAVAAVCATALLPLCMQKRLGALHAVSAAAVGGFVYTAVVIVLRGVQLTMARQPHFEGVDLFRWDAGTLYAVPIIVFGFNCHANVVSIFSELHPDPGQLIRALPESPTQFHPYGLRPASRKLVGMIGVIASAITLIMVGYVCVGAAGYLAFPTNVVGNVLKMFGEGDPLIQVARGVIGLVVLGHFPLNHHPARQSFDAGLRDVLGWGHIPGAASLAFTLTFVYGSAALSVLVGDLGDVLHLLGGTVSCFIIFFLPGLLLMNAAVVKHSRSRLEQALLTPGGQGEEEEEDGSDTAATEARMAALMAASEHGLKKTGLIYSPGKSWVAGVVLVVISSAIFMITVVTTFAGSG